MTGPAFYQHALERLAGIESTMTISVRTLPAEQLAAEIEALAVMPQSLAGTLMLAIYRSEAARRASPEMAFDDELDAALSRLANATTAEDRERVTEIGRTLYRLDGYAAMRRAGDRMLAAVEPKHQGLRAAILAKRWPGYLDQAA